MGQNRPKNMSKIVSNNTPSKSSKWKSKVGSDNTQQDVAVVRHYDMDILQAQQEEQD